MNLPSYFKDLLTAIEPSQSYKNDMRAGHLALRKRLAEDEDFSRYHLNTFLQGSYKRGTAIHPGKDVDIVVVTSIDPDQPSSAKNANALLGKCLRKYYDNVEPQTRSFGITLSYVKLDVVLAASRKLTKEAVLLKAVRVADEIDDSSAWADYPLVIPDRNLGDWVDTDPKRQLKWTSELNSKCDGYFVPLVKMFKWWRKEAYGTPKYPKGYILERIAGECVDPTARDHAEGFVKLLANIKAKFGVTAALGIVPHLSDPGVPSHNVAERLAPEDFQVFMKKVSECLPIAQAALAEGEKAKSADLWRKVFGDKFPAAPVEKAASFPPVPVRPNKPAGFA